MKIHYFAIPFTLGAEKLHTSALTKSRTERQFVMALAMKYYSKKIWVLEPFHLTCEINIVNALINASLILPEWTEHLGRVPEWSVVKPVWTCSEPVSKKLRNTGRCHQTHKETFPWFCKVNKFTWERTEKKNISTKLYFSLHFPQERFHFILPHENNKKDQIK